MRVGGDGGRLQHQSEVVAGHDGVEAVAVAFARSGSGLGEVDGEADRRDAAGFQLVGGARVLVAEVRRGGRGGGG